jgi:hypothetical protein
MRFFDQFRKPEFYRDTTRHSFWGSVGKLLFATSVVGVVAAITMYVHFFKTVPDLVDSFITKGQAGYPQNLVITISKDGVLSKNQPGLITLYPLEGIKAKPQSANTSGPTYLLAINDTAQASLESLRQADAVLLLAHDGTVYIGDHNDVRITPYDRVITNGEALTFSSSTAATIAEGIREYMPYMVPLFFVVVIISCAIGLFFWYLLYGLLIGLIVMALSKSVLKHRMDFSTSYVLTLYALAPVSVVAALLYNTPGVTTILSVIPFSDLILVVLFLWYMFTRSTPASHEASTNA